MKENNKEKIIQILKNIQDQLVEIRELGFVGGEYEDEDHPEQPLDHEELR